MLDFRPQLSAINGANLDAVVRFATTSLDDAERLLRLQHEATRRLFASNVEALRAIVEPGGNGDTFAEWSKLCAGNVGAIFDVTRECIEVMSHSQAEFVQMIGQQAGTMHQYLAETAASLLGTTDARGAVPEAASEEVVRPKLAA